jgi:hypothetical protein
MTGIVRYALDSEKSRFFRADELPQVPDYARKPPTAKHQEGLFGQ